MQCDLLLSDFKKPDTIALVKEKIRHIPGGSFPHCGGALNLVLKKGFELKKQKRQPPGAELHCPWGHKCVSYSSIGSGLCCPSCGNYMTCAHCGYSRTSSYSSCKSCGSRFI